MYVFAPRILWVSRRSNLIIFFDVEERPVSKYR
jgi:hypothetical protein